MFLKNLSGNFWKNFQKRGLWSNTYVYIHNMKYIGLFILITFFIILSLMVGDFISDKFPNTIFSKWWKESIISEEDEPLN